MTILTMHLCSGIFQKNIDFDDAVYYGKHLMNNFIAGKNWGRHAFSTENNGRLDVKPFLTLTCLTSYQYSTLGVKINVMHMSGRGGRGSGYNWSEAEIINVPLWDEE